MEIINLDEGRKSPFSVVCALGNFDGFHRGHQALINRVLQIQAEGRERGEELRSSVLLFDFPKPQKPGMMSLKDKIVYLETQGLDQLFIKKFDPAFMHLSIEAFMHDFLEDKMQARYLVTGRDYTFAYKAQGHVADLEKEADQGCFKVSVVPDVLYRGERISSTRIRQAILDGDFEEAEKMAGHPYTIHGRIGHGFGRGRHLGFPTANLEMDFPYLLPKNGVYLSYMHFPSDQKFAEDGYFGMTNVGSNPTFTDDRKIWVETNLLDFNEDIYGKEADLTFLAFQREELKFDNADQLIHQMKEDEKISRNLMTKFCGRP